MIGACATALVMLLDASASISDGQWQEMVAGHADGLAGPPVIRAIEQGGGLAVSVIAFDAGTAVVLPWRVLRSQEDAVAAGKALTEAPRPLRGSTRIGQALRAGLDALGAAPCGDRQVLDLVTDGDALDAPDAEDVRDEAAARGVTINALGVGRPAMEWLERHAVTHGGFALQAPTWAEFAGALRRKLVLEAASAGGGR